MVRGRKLNWINCLVKASEWVCRGSRQVYAVGAEGQCYYATCAFVQHDKSDINSPVLRAAPAQVVEHVSDTGFSTLLIADTPCCPSLDHLYVWFECLGEGSQMAVAYSTWCLTRLKQALVFMCCSSTWKFLWMKANDELVFIVTQSAWSFEVSVLFITTPNITSKWPWWVHCLYSRLQDLVIWRTLYFWVWNSTTNAKPTTLYCCMSKLTLSPIVQWIASDLVNTEQPAKLQQILYIAVVIVTKDWHTMTTQGLIDWSQWKDWLHW